MVERRLSSPAAIRNPALQIQAGGSWIAPPRRMACANDSATASLAISASAANANSARHSLPGFLPVHRLDRVGDARRCCYGLHLPFRERIGQKGDRRAQPMSPFASFGFL